MMEDGSPGFGIYVHWPFCASKCPYCDFNSHVRNAGIVETSFVTAFCRELEAYRGLVSEKVVDTIYFGGGTPSLMSEGAVDRILESIGRQWQFSPDIEVTLEANPTSADAGRFSGYRKSGVNRLSLGVQSLRDEDLRFLGRLHTVDEAIAAVKLAQSIFDRTSFDLIYARPGQCPKDWRRELRDALQIQDGHLSLYQLVIEPQTAFADLYSAGKITIPGDEAALALYELTREQCERFGLSDYEVSNYAVPGQESRHNLIYWNYGNYIGLGPGAHGRPAIDNRAFAISNIRAPEIWRDSVIRNGIGYSVTDELTSLERATEFVIMGLRLKQGINLTRLARHTGFMLDLSQLEILESEKLVALDQSRQQIRVTQSGRLVLNSIVNILTDALSPRVGVWPTSKN